MIRHWHLQLWFGIDICNYDSALASAIMIQHWHLQERCILTATGLGDDWQPMTFVSNLTCWPIVMVTDTGWIGSRQQLAKGVFWGSPAVLWGQSTPNSTRVSWKTLILKIWPIFPVCMSICGGLAPCGPSALLATKKASFGEKPCHLAIPLITGQKNADLSQLLIFSCFFTFDGSKGGVLGQKTVFSGVLDRMWGSRPDTKTGDNHNGP